MRYRSREEGAFAGLLAQAGLPVDYEPHRFRYVLERYYTPDFLVQNVYVEIKGHFDALDRRKFLAVRDQHPEVHVLLLLIKPNTRISKAYRALTYGQWATKHGLWWRPFPRTPQDVAACLAEISSRSTTPAPGALPATRPAREQMVLSSAIRAAKAAGRQARPRFRRRRRPTRTSTNRSKPQ